MRKYNECDFVLTKEDYAEWKKSVEVYVQALIGRRPDAVDMAYAENYFQQATMHYIELKEKEAEANSHQTVQG